MKLGSLLSNVVHRILTLPTGLKVVLGTVLLAVVGVASVLMYEAYDYVQHDNQFCLECHLMQDPFEQFAQSAHRGLGCKACHRPNILERSEMGLAQIVENPDSIRVHAHVSNDICAECHIKGNPDEWRLVANTAGHRIHLESDDPALQGLNCVECHSSGVHQFTPTDQTCGQGGCHESTEIRLGKMADLTIHCATCHDFARPVPVGDTPGEVATALRPEATECLSCHQMRAMMPNLPPDEPHNAECGACHNPHEQSTPQEAVQTCATGGCHAAPDTLTPYHQGLDPGVLENCTTCHEAHEFRIHGAGLNCLECHSDIYDDAPGGTISGVGHPDRVGLAPAVRGGEAEIVSAEPVRPIRVASAGAIDPALIRLALASHVPAASAPARAATQDTVRFWHAEHRGVDCTACHSMQTTHGGLTVASLQDCRSCHHTEPVAADCQRCHSRGDVRRLTATVRRRMDITVGSLNRPTRSLPFDHATHGQLDCASCHTEGAALSAAAVSCSGCHTEHHQPTNDCKACHDRPAGNAHNLQVHLGCAGSGCHTAIPAPVRNVPRTRDFCLVCHQDLVDHRPGRNCESCHTLPRPRTAQAGTASNPAQP